MIQFLKSDVAAFRLYIISTPCLGVFPLLIMFFFSPSSPEQVYWAYFIVLYFLIFSLLLNSLLREAAGEKGMPVFPRSLLESSFSPIKTMLLDFLSQAIVVFSVTTPVLLVCVLLFGFDETLWSVIGAAIAARIIGTALLWIVGRKNIYLAFGIAVACMVAILTMIKLMGFESSVTELQAYLLISVTFFVLAFLNSIFPFVTPKGT